MSDLEAVCSWRYVHPRSHTRQGQRSLVFCQAAPHRGCIHVSLVLEDDLPQVFIDKIQIQLVLFNLVRNAMEALERSPRREIGIKTLRSKDGVVEVQVRDTGPGVDPRLVDQVFTEYFSTKEHGMGVGLSICQSIVDAHGGRLWATNTSGGGATFHFTLPIVEPEHGEQL